MPYDPRLPLSFLTHPDPPDYDTWLRETGAAPDDGEDDAPPRREPRRLARLVALDTAAADLLSARLDRVDRRAPLAADTIAAINRLLARARPVLARCRRRARPRPVPADGRAVPFIGVRALFELRAALADAAGQGDDPPPDLPW